MMKVSLVVLFACLIGCSFGFSYLVSFPGDGIAQTISVPNTIEPGTGMLLTLRAKDLDFTAFPDSITISMEENHWVWLNRNTRDDPFTTFSAGVVVQDHRENNQGVTAYYVVPHEVATSWVTDGVLSINVDLGSNTDLPIADDFVTMQISFNPGNVVGDPHVHTVFGDYFDIFSGMYTLYVDELVTMNVRTSEPYHGFFITEFAVMFDDQQTNWVLHGSVDSHYLPRLTFNNAEINTDSVLLNGDIRFTSNVKNELLQEFEGQANEGYIRSVCYISLPNMAQITIRVGLDELAGGYYEMIVYPAPENTRVVAPGGMLMMSHEEARSTENVSKFSVNNIFKTVHLN